MKKNVRFLSLALISLFAAVIVISCQKETDEELDLMFKATTISSPVSDGDIVPNIIDGANKGGNRTCEEVAAAFNTSFDLCGDKINYDDYLTEDEFENAFPLGLNVEVDGIYVSFNAADCIEIGGKYYKVGAVIVKGANAANVYYYPGGSLSDSGLAAPGDQAMVSNLTFCFVECVDPLVVAVKTFYYAGTFGYSGVYTWGASKGIYPFASVPCNNVGYNVLSGTSLTFELHPYLNFTTKLGIVTVEEGITGWDVTLDLENSAYGIDKTHIYIGPLSGLLTTACTAYTVAPWYSDFSDGNVVTFTVPY